MSEGTESTDKLLVSIKRKVGIIEINRPDSLHALDIEVLEGLIKQLKAFQDDPKVRVILIGTTGGRAFSAGLDTKAIFEGGEEMKARVVKNGTILSGLIFASFIKYWIIPSNVSVDVTFPVSERSLQTQFGFIRIFSSLFVFILFKDISIKALIITFWLDSPDSRVIIYTFDFITL